MTIFTSELRTYLFSYLCVNSAIQPPMTNHTHQVAPMHIHQFLMVSLSVNDFAICFCLLTTFLLASFHVAGRRVLLHSAALEVAPVLFLPVSQVAHGLQHNVRFPVY